MAEHVHILGEGGSVFKMDLPLPEAIADRLAKGYLHQVNADGSPFGDTGGVSGSSAPTSRPAINAPKAEWVGWAAVNGMSPDDADAATKQDLIEKFGATAEPVTEAAAVSPDDADAAPGEPDAPTA